MSGKKKKAILTSRNVTLMGIFLGLLVLMFCIPVSAVTITESPDTINRGGQISISINDLPDNSEFSLLIEGTFGSTPGASFSFGTNNLNMPFTLTNGVISATTENTDYTDFTVQKSSSGSTFTAGDYSTNGIYTTKTYRDISSGVYMTLLFDGTTLPDKNQVKTTMNMRGTKTGPVKSDLSFNVDGVDNGEVRVIVLVNGAQALSKVVIIGNGIPVVSSTPSGSSPVVAAGTTIAADISGVATATSTTVPASSKTFYSADRTVSITAEGVDYIGLLSVDAKNIPAGWITLGDAYTIAPDNLALYPAGDLTITLPTQTNSGADYAYFIGQYQNGEWGVVPSSPANNAIKIKINKAGTYALMALKSESSVPATVSTTAATGSSAIQSPTASGSPTPKGTPKIASIALAETPVPALTKKAPLDILVVFGALGIFGAVLVIRKRK